MEFRGRTQPPPDPVEIEGETEHEVAAILDSKLDKRRSAPLMYLVKWTGYEGTPDESTWETAENLEHAPDPDFPRYHKTQRSIFYYFAPTKVFTTTLK